jgi:hypothetical protein
MIMGELFIFIGMCLLGAFCVIGLIEWVKSVRDAVISAVKHTGKITTIAWPVLSIVFAVGMGFALGKMPSSTIFGATYNAVIFASVLMLAFNEILGYNVIVKLIFYWVDKVVYGDKIPDAVAPKIEMITEKVKEIIPDKIIDPAPVSPVVTTGTITGSPVNTTGTITGTL